MDKEHYDRIMKRNGEYDTTSKWYDRNFNRGPKNLGEELFEEGKAVHISDGIGQHRYVLK